MDCGNLSDVPFVRLPTALCEAHLRKRLAGVEWVVLMWTIRQTFGWRRDCVSFSWYSIAKSIGLDRSSVVRAGNRLIANGILVVQNRQIGVAGTLWRESVASTGGAAAPVPPGTGASPHPLRSADTAFSRRLKDSYKEKSESP